MGHGARESQCIDQAYASERVLLSLISKSGGVHYLNEKGIEAFCESAAFTASLADMRATVQTTFGYYACERVAFCALIVAQAERQRLVARRQRRDAPRARRRREGAA